MNLLKKKGSRMTTFPQRPEQKYQLSSYGGALGLFNDSDEPFFISLRFFRIPLNSEDDDVNEDISDRRDLFSLTDVHELRARNPPRNPFDYHKLSSNPVYLEKYEKLFDMHGLDIIRDRHVSKFIIAPNQEISLDLECPNQAEYGSFILEIKVNVESASGKKNTFKERIKVLSPFD